MDTRSEQLKALADPTRLRIVALLRERGETCVCEILDELGTTQANISTHLRVLRSVGLIRGQKVGKWVFYALADEAVAELLAWLQATLGPRPEPARPRDSVFACCSGGTVPLSRLEVAKRRRESDGE